MKNIERLKKSIYDDSELKYFVELKQQQRIMLVRLVEACYLGQQHGVWLLSSICRVLCKVLPCFSNQNYLDHKLLFLYLWIFPVTTSCLKCSVHFHLVVET